MWAQKFSKAYLGITKEEVWHMWSDVNRYTEWHDDLDYCKLKGDFAVGNHFMLKPKGAPAVKVMITELIPNKRFVDCTHFLGAKMVDIHEVEEAENGVIIHNTIQVTGGLGFIWVKLVAKKVADSAPKETDTLVRLILQRKNHG